MDLRILLAPDKFKGTLDAPSVAAAMALGVRDALPDAEVRLHPLADGGEGSLDCVAATVPGSFATIAAEDAFGAPVAVRAFDDGTVAMIAAHETQRLATRPVPAAALRASSRGTGLALVEARRSFPEREIVVWVGGTASTDGAAGAAAAAGWRFEDARGRELESGGGALRRLARIEPPPTPVGGSITGACDVDNPLLGERGAARMFSSQKGAGPSEMQVLEEGLHRLAECVRRDVGIDVASLPHGGAGGGLGAGLVAFFGGTLDDGFSRIASATGLHGALEWADVVLTGEGRVDEGSLGGKVASNVAHLCTSARKTCIVVAGEVALPVGLLPAERALGAAAVASVVDGCGRAAAFAETAGCVRKVTAEVVRRRVAPR